jgi:hypothetical protein
MRIGRVAGKDGAVEAGGDVEDERGHVFVLHFEEVGDLRRDADLVLASELETLGLVGDLHEEPDALFFGGGVGLDHLYQTVDLAGQGVDRGGEDGVKLAEVCELPGDIGGEGVEGLGVFGEEGERVGRRQCSRVTRHTGQVKRKAGRSSRARVKYMMLFCYYYATSRENVRVSKSTCPLLIQFSPSIPSMHDIVRRCHHRCFFPDPLEALFVLDFPIWN